MSPAYQVAMALAASITPSNFTASGTFPTSIFTKYYNNPTVTSVQVQPVVSDPVMVEYNRLASIYTNIDEAMNEA